MTRFYKITSVVYRIGLLLLIPLYLIAFAVTDDESATNHSSIKDVLFLSYISVSVLLLTFYQNCKFKCDSVKNKLRFALIGLTIISFIFTFKMLFGLFYSDAHLSVGDIFAYLVVFLFGLITAYVLLGLVKNINK